MADDDDDEKSLLSTIILSANGLCLKSRPSSLRCASLLQLRSTQEASRLALHRTYRHAKVPKVIHTSSAHWYLVQLYETLRRFMRSFLPYSYKLWYELRGFSAKLKYGKKMGLSDQAIHWQSPWCCRNQ